MMTRKTTATALVALTGLIGLAGCDTTAPNAAGPQHASGAASSTSTIAMITITDYQYFTPDSVRPGSTILVVNESEVNHTLTAENKSDFNVTVMAGTSAAFIAPNAPGTYVYTCAFHPGIIFTLVVA